MNYSEEKTPLPEEMLAEQVPEGKVVTESEVKRLAHLPLLTVFYLSLQKQVSATPVTALELAAYLEGRGMVRAFRDDIPAYSLNRELNEISVKDMLEILGEFHQQVKAAGGEIKVSEARESNEKYRKIYSELASEILQLFGEESANQLPV